MMDTGTRLVITSNTADRRALSLNQGGQLFGGSVALDDKADPDVLEAVAHLVGQPEDALQIDVALECRGHLGEVYAAGRRDVGEPGREARRQRMQEKLHGRRGVVRSDGAAG